MMKPQDQAAMNRVDSRQRGAPHDRRSSPLFILVAVISTIAALYFAKAILLPLALAILLSFLLAPLADRLERWRVPRVPAVLAIVLMVFVVFIGVGSIVTYQLVDLTQQFKDHETTLIKKMEDLRPDSQLVARVSKTFNEVRNALAGKPAENQANPQSPPASTESKAVEVKVVELPQSVLAQIHDWLGALLAPTATAGLVIVLVLFMLLDRENQRSRLVQLFGRSHLHSTTEAIHEVAGRVGSYLRMLFLVNAGYGLAIAAGLWLIGVPGAIMWGVLGFSLRFLPYIGAWIGATIPLLISIATTEGWTQPLLVLGWYVVVELVVYNVIEPLVYGKSVGVSTIGVIISAIFWTWLWGPVGLILAMPMTVCLLVTARYVPQLYFITLLLADQSPLSAAERLYGRWLAFDFHEPLKLARAHLKESTLASFYDEVMVPALTMAEHDRHAGLLNDDQTAFVVEAAEDLVEELNDTATSTQGTKPAGQLPTTIRAEDVGHSSLPKARVLCIPLRDEADEAAARMLAQLLVVEGFSVDIGGADSLTGEMVDRVADSEIDIVVISILPPITPRDSRLLWKRLRSRYPDLPIVVGFWTESPGREGLPVPGEEDVASRTVTSLGEAVATVRGTTIRQRPIAKTG
jgi:predicted PurR-regulated permease PerM